LHCDIQEYDKADSMNFTLLENFGDKNKIGKFKTAEQINFPISIPFPKKVIVFLW
jgi:hypothetical protein